MKSLLHDPDGSALWSRAHEADRTGRHVIVLDTTLVRSKAEFLVVAQRRFMLPDWFGHNWDALEESLNDLPDDRLTVLWVGVLRWWHCEPAQLQTAVNIVEAVATAGSKDFEVVLLGAWPNEMATD